VLRELGGPGMLQYSNAQLSDLFAGLRQQKINLIQAATITPQVTEQPSVSPQGLLRLVGYLQIQQLRIEFQMVFQPFQGEWRLFGMNVGAKPQVAAASEASPSEPVKSTPTASLPVSAAAQKALGKAAGTTKQ
jgi:hypothetical protein